MQGVRTPVRSGFHYDLPGMGEVLDRGDPRPAAGRSPAGPKAHSLGQATRGACGPYPCLFPAHGLADLAWMRAKGLSKAGQRARADGDTHREFPQLRSTSPDPCSLSSAIGSCQGEKQLGPTPANSDSLSSSSSNPQLWPGLDPSFGQELISAVWSLALDFLSHSHHFRTAEVGPSSNKGQDDGVCSAAGGADEQNWGVSAHLCSAAPSEGFGSGLQRMEQDRARGWTSVWGAPLQKQLSSSLGCT